MKSRPRPLRLGSFEALESRAMLAHGGLDFAEFSFHAVRFAGENQGPPRLVEQGLGPIHSARDTRHEPPAIHAGGMGHRSEIRIQDDRSFDVGAVTITVTPVIIVPVTQVIVLINIPAPPVSQSPTLTPPTSSGNISSSRLQSIVAPHGNLGNSVLSSSASPRTSSVTRNSLDSLSVATSLSFQRTDNENDAVDESEVSPTGSDHESAPRKCNERDVIAQLPPRDAAAEVQADSEDDSERIEFTREDPLTSSKRKAARKPTSSQADSNAILNSALRSQRQLDAPQLRQHDAWLETAAAEAGFSPVGDDLIELLANDSSEVATPPAQANSFEASAAIPIEATLGYFRASETDVEQSSPESAAVAAAALPVPSGK